MQNLKLSFQASGLAGLKISARNNFGNSSKADLKFFRPIGRNANAKFKGAPNFYWRKFKNPEPRFVRIVAD